MLQKSFVVLAAAVALSAPVCAQAPGGAPGRGQGQPQARAERPALDPHRLDMYMCDWRESMPRHTHGGMVERDILTRGDQRNPPRRCAVLTVVNRLSYATLAARAGFAPMKLQGEQEVFYVTSGKGTITSAGETQDLYDGIAVLAPAGVEFSIKNTGDSDLNMYLINEPVPAGAKTAPKPVVKDMNLAQVRSSTGHWIHIVRTVFERPDGLASLNNILQVSFDPMTIGEPHAHSFGQEEVWLQVKGNSLAFIGTQLRRQGPGVAYLAPPGEPDSKANVSAGLTFPHSNINPGNEQIRFLYFSKLN